MFLLLLPNSWDYGNRNIPTAIVKKPDESPATFTQGLMLILGHGQI